LLGLGEMVRAVSFIFGFQICLSEFGQCYCPYSVIVHYWFLNGIYCFLGFGRRFGFRIFRLFIQIITQSLELFMIVVFLKGVNLFM